MSLAPPSSTYAAWLDLLERFQAGDDEVLPALEAGVLTWSSAPRRSPRAATGAAC